jgi:hypothetical protein
VDILVFSDGRRAESYFRISRRSERFSVPAFLPRRDLKTALKASAPGSFIYLDLSGLTDTETAAQLRLLARSDHIHFGVLDPGGKVKDVAELFRQGAVDYAGKSVLQEGITLKRLNKVFLYLSGGGPAARLAGFEQRTARATELESDLSWERIVKGREYLFYFLFVELDGKEEMVKNYGRDNLDIALGSFRNFISRGVAPFGGRIWIWSRFGGIVLFPFNRALPSPVECIYRLVLFKPFYDIEESLFPNFISFRIALHMGRTVYDTKNTGHIVSESLNGVFHLGQQFAAAGNIYVSEDILPFIPSVFKSYFLDAGVFEGRKIFRMRRPLHQVGRN